MPVHDWSPLDAGLFHSFHNTWISQMVLALNGGLLPEGYYALDEQVVGDGKPDVIALGRTPDDPPSGASVSLLTAPPRAKVVARAERESYTRRQRRLVIRHTSGDEVVALIEIVSAGNKSADYPWRQFIDKALGALRQGIHLLILDLHPPTLRDPEGVHGSIWSELTGEPYTRPTNADRTVAAYSAGDVKTAYVEPLAIGDSLPDIPLFLTDDGGGYILLPLEPTYRAAFAGVPSHIRRQLDAALPRSTENPA